MGKMFNCMINKNNNAPKKWEITIMRDELSRMNSPFAEESHLSKSEMRLLRNLYDTYLKAISTTEDNYTDHKKHKTHMSWDTGLDSVSKDDPWNPQDKWTNT